MERIGKKRYDLPWMEKELDLDFKEAIVNFPKNVLPDIYALLEKYSEGKKIVILFGHKITLLKNNSALIY